jgi:hypothetical protein
MLASHKRLPNGINVAAEIAKDERMRERRNAEFATPLATPKAKVPHQDSQPLRHEEFARLTEPELTRVCAEFSQQKGLPEQGLALNYWHLASELCISAC